MKKEHFCSPAFRASAPNSWPQVEVCSCGAVRMDDGRKVSFWVKPKPVSSTAMRLKGKCIELAPEVRDHLRLEEGEIAFWQLNDEGTVTLIGEKAMNEFIADTDSNVCNDPSTGRYFR